MPTNISKVSLMAKKRVRRHHNNTGLRQIKRGKTIEQVERMAKRLRRNRTNHNEEVNLHIDDTTQIRWW